MKNTAVVLHWWCDNPNILPYQDRSNPVVLTAACIWAWNPNIPIYVIDVSTCDRPTSHWRHFPYKFGFKVLKRTSFLGELVPHFGRLFNFRLLSRVWDVEMAMRDVVEDNIIFMDSDIFALRSLDPAPGVKNPEFFYSNFNNGVWFYNKKARNSRYVFDYWKGMICRAIHDDDFRHQLYNDNPGYGTYYMQDEIIYRSLTKMLPNHVRSVDMSQNYLFQWLYVDPKEVVEQVRGLHCLSFITGTDRQRLFLSIKELWNVIVRWLDNHDYELIFGDRRPTDAISVFDLYSSPKNLQKLYILLGIQGQESVVFDNILKEMTDRGSLRLPLL